MPEDLRFLRIHSYGGIAMSDLLRFLSDLEYAYNGFVAFDSIVRRLSADPFSPTAWPWVFPGWRRRGPAALTIEREEVASLVLPRQRLRVDAIRIGSPGFWDFLGKSVSVEAISNALSERQRRRELDRQEPHRRRMEDLKEADKETEAILNRYRALREMGLSEDELAPLRSQLIERPMRELGRHQDSGLIVDVEVFDPDERPQLPPGETVDG